MLVEIPVGNHHLVCGHAVEPAGWEMNLPRAPGARPEPLALSVDDDQLLVVREQLPDRREVVVEPSARWTAAGGPSSALDIFRHLVGACEHPDVEEALLEPEVELARSLRTHALQLLVDLVGQRVAALDVRDPGHPQGGDQRGQEGKAHDPALDALQPEYLGDLVDEGLGDGWCGVGHLPVYISSERPYTMTSFGWDRRSSG